jgi:hypothetical protein
MGREIPIRHEEVAARKQGERAALRGSPRFANPFTDRTLADAWQYGYVDGTRLRGSVVSVDRSRRRKA